MDLVHSGVAVAVRSAPRADLGSEDAVRAPCWRARSLSYSTGPSGVALARLFERWGIAQEIAPCIVQAPPGVPVGTLVARGEVELGFQQLSELLHLPGITLAGPLPEPIQITTTFSGAVATAAAPACGRAGAAGVHGVPQAAPAKRRQGMEPALAARRPDIHRFPKHPRSPSWFLIIDCHGHYTTAPKALENWRNAQIAGIKDPAAMPKVADLKISDDELRESIETNQLKLMKERGSDITLFSPAPASWPTRYIGDFNVSSTWAAICNELCYRVSTLFPDHFLCHWPCCRRALVSIRHLHS